MWHRIKPNMRLKVAKLISRLRPRLKTKLKPKITKLRSWLRLRWRPKLWLSLIHISEPTRPY